VSEGSIIVEFEIAGEDASDAVQELQEEIEADTEVLASIGPVTESSAFTAVDASGNESAAVESGQVNLGPPPISEPEPPADAEIVQAVTLTFDAELDVEDEEAVDDFIEDFIAQLAALLGIDASDITVTSVSEGSIIVEFEIAGEDASDAVQELQEEIEADPEVLASIGPVTESSAFTAGDLDMGDAGIDEQLVETYSFTNNPDDPDAVLIVAAAIEGDGFSVDVETLSIAAGESDDLDITFAAADVGNLNGTYTGVLTLTTNDANNRTTVIDLTAAISAGLAEAEIAVSGAFNFASVAINTTKELELTIENSGDLELTGDIAVDGAAFSVSDASFVLAGGEALAVTVTFAPTAVESSVGTITITSNDAANPEVTVDLSGAGFDPGEVQVLVDADGNTILGDFDGNAKVNLEDFFIFADNFGQADFAAGTDLDGDGKVTLDDFFVFSDNFGLSGTYVGGS
jgi:phosphotransferase system HPr-like phosphotransfer protein